MARAAFGLAAPVLLWESGPKLAWQLAPAVRVQLAADVVLLRQGLSAAGLPPLGARAEARERRRGAVSSPCRSRDSSARPTSSPKRGPETGAGSCWGTTSSLARGGIGHRTADGPEKSIGDVVDRRAGPLGCSRRNDAERRPVRGRGPVWSERRPQEWAGTRLGSSWGCGPGCGPARWSRHSVRRTREPTSATLSRSSSPRESDAAARIFLLRREYLPGGSVRHSRSSRRGPRR